MLIRLKRFPVDAFSTGHRENETYAFALPADALLREDGTPVHMSVEWRSEFDALVTYAAAV